MTPLSIRTLLAGFLALTCVSALSIWAVTVPNVISASTYAAIAALLIALGAVTLISARNGGATGSLGQLLYETEHPVRATRHTR